MLLLLKIIIIGLAIFVVFRFLILVMVVHDNDNYPMVHDGDLLIFQRTADTSKYYSGDLIVYEVDGKNRTGRVAGLPGDTVEISETSYTVNGINPYESVYYNTLPAESEQVTYPFTVPENKIFVLADYRDKGKDSRTFGAVIPKGKIILQLRHRGF